MPGEQGRGAGRGRKPAAGRPRRATSSAKPAGSFKGKPGGQRGKPVSSAGPRAPRPATDSRGPRSRPPGPRVPDEITPDMLDPAARAELRTLPADLADSVARHLVAAGLQEDPDVGYQHAKEARRLAARVGLVREACGVAAYRAGQWAEAIAELRAARRLTGRNTALPLIADSERALGRLDRALAVVHAPEVAGLDRATQIELVIVESGIRRDQGLADAALIVLQVPELNDGRRHPWSARLCYAYADALLELERRDEARDWFARAAAADPDGETDAAERFDELDDVILEDLGEP